MRVCVTLYLRVYILNGVGAKRSERLSRHLLAVYQVDQLSAFNMGGPVYLPSVYEVAEVKVRHHVIE